MAGYGGRKGPNIAQYVASLNAIPPAHDVVNQQEENFNIEHELAQFTNAEFLDFDAGGFLEQPVQEYDSDQDKHGRSNAAAAHDDNVKGLDFGNST